MTDDAQAVENYPLSLTVSIVIGTVFIGAGLLALIAQVVSGLIRLSLGLPLWG